MAILLNKPEIPLAPNTTLTAGMELHAREQCVGLGSAESLDLTIIYQGDVLTYIKPATLLCRTKHGELVEVRLEHLGFMSRRRAERDRDPST